MAWNMNFYSFVVLVFLLFGTHPVNGQLYFGNIGGLSGWFGKASDRYIKHITATQCAGQTCIPYPLWSEDFNGREFEGSQSPNVEGTVDENGRLIGLLDNVSHKRGSIKTIWAGPKTAGNTKWPMIDDSHNSNWDINTTGTGVNKEKDIKGKNMTGTDISTDPEGHVHDKKSDDADKKWNSTSTERRSAPLVQVYVVASGAGGAHTNIGDGGFYGKNNGHAITTGKDAHDGKKGWSGGVSWKGNKDGDENTMKPQEWTAGQSQQWAPIETDQQGTGQFVNIEDQTERDFGISMMDDKMSEASTKYHFGYHGINIKPESLATRARSKLLQNWHKSDLVNGYWRFWFRR